jgi:hypothetical protein
MSMAHNTSSPSVTSFGRITSVVNLRAHLQVAIELEQSTLPPYLCALYSLDTSRNAAAAEVMRSVFLEEMLHLALVANLLNAVGGRPHFDKPAMLPGYPRSLPHGDPSFEMSLLPFGRDALDQFSRLEHPRPVEGPAQGDRYATIGQFYESIRRALHELCAEFGEANVFCGDPARQVANGFHRALTIDNLSSAVAAVDEIVDQGEGASQDVWDGERDMFHPERDEVAHYYRMQELLTGRRYRRGDTPQSGPTGDTIDVDLDGAQPMQPNPRTTNHDPGSPIRIAQDAFNVTYCRLLGSLDQTFNGQPETLRDGMGIMFALKKQALALMQIPTEDGRTTAGPTFEYVSPEARG